MPATELAERPLDLTTCDREPIHIPGSIQPHGVLLVLDEPSLRVSLTSSNTVEHFGMSPQSLLGAELGHLLQEQEAANLAAQIQNANLNEGPLYLLTVSAAVSKYSFHVVAHRYLGKLIVEFERTQSSASPSFQQLFPIVSTMVGRLKRAETPQAIAYLASREVKELAGFDRVLVYKFDRNWNGQVIGEAKDERFSSYLHLWFPASDIPQQARKLYELNRTRLIADVNYRPATFVARPDSRTEAPLDLSFAALRSVSPVHLEYLKNMAVESSMSLSLLTSGGRLWGLIACHHSEPRFVPVETRTACDLLAQTVSTQLEISEQRASYERRLWLTSVTTRLVAYMAQEEEFLEGLVKHSEELLTFGAAGGGAVIHEGICTRFGVCPAEAEVWKIVNWLGEQDRTEVFHTDRLSLILPQADVCEYASGLLALPISQVYRSYVLWFRPEVVRTVDWGGDPRKPVEIGLNPERLHPRKSFETWKETVRGCSLPWHTEEIEVAAELRNAIIGIVLKKAEELAQISAELQKSNQELEAFSYSVSHDLRAPFRHILGYSELLKDSAAAKLSDNEKRYLEVIIQSANFAGTLVDNLLSFSQLGRATLNVKKVDTNRLVGDVRRDLEQEAAGRDVVWRVGDLPSIEADELLLRLVWQNLLQNALKYSYQREQTLIEVEGHEEADEIVFSISDNGAGFEQAYAGRLFGVFQRLHRMEDFPGTGIGLANVKRIVMRHGGRVWATGEVDRGARFYFTLPKGTAQAER